MGQVNPGETYSKKIEAIDMCKSYSEMGYWSNIIIMPINHDSSSF